MQVPPKAACSSYMPMQPPRDSQLLSSLLGKNVFALTCCRPHHLVCCLNRVSPARSLRSDKVNVAAIGDFAFARVIQAPSPLSATAAVGPAGFAAISQDYTTVCITGALWNQHACTQACIQQGVANMQFSDKASAACLPACCTLLATRAPFPAALQATWASPCHASPSSRWACPMLGRPHT